ncbi:hypothetical protein CCACVL1_17770 [Corchorus capsularis]|uniref:Late embryogenesis abundant protein, LEA-14 n=1 Tax=Corchorus capsularis TaxID=210143 RepID=A0A1R3HQ71_COCAP|nr:hypothetical protein CCACVL1_17770 [Corchorus capsularis]
MEQRNGSYVNGVPINVRVQAPPFAPPPQQVIPAATADHHLRDLILIICAGILVIAGIILTIALTSKRSFPKFGLKSLSVSELNITGSEITGHWNAEFMVRNPDIVSYTYQHPIFALLYKNQAISAIIMDKIHLKHKTTKSFVANGTVALSRRIVDNDNQVVVDEIARDYWSQGIVAFTVGFLYADHRAFLSATCRDVKVGFSNHSSHGTLLLDGFQYSPKITDHQAFTLCSTHAI